MGLIRNYQCFGMVRCSIKPPVESRDLNPTRNGATERSKHRECSQGTEKEAIRKAHEVGIVQEANALSNVGDMLTWTL